MENPNFSVGGGGQGGLPLPAQGTFRLECVLYTIKRGYRRWITNFEKPLYDQTVRDDLISGVPLKKLCKIIPSTEVLGIISRKKRQYGTLETSSWL